MQSDRTGGAMMDDLRGGWLPSWRSLADPSTDLPGRSIPPFKAGDSWGDSLN
jgi:hypothetical protein